ncbi:hypothetical protein [Streptomyces sp. CRN 30]|uniref:hypothetical protein n=1 Tax=Streptomyces sp. CRN 30 TaxID=3075613 RepID=UPI002A80B2F3|nr:hypothetical protein [Streptomyces sp. CRN 30]
MAHPVLALGAALLTAAGCVWYLPALAELRAGADRPDSRRGRAAACLSGWATLAGVAVLLEAADPWWAPGTAAAAGAALTAALWTRAAVRSRHEARETARAWTTLTPGPPPAAPHHPRYVFAALTGIGLAASVSSALLLTTAGDGPRPWPALAVPAVLVALSLTAAIGTAAARR